MSNQFNNESEEQVMERYMRRQIEFMCQDMMIAEPDLSPPAGQFEDSGQRLERLNRIWTRVSTDHMEWLAKKRKEAMAWEPNDEFEKMLDRVFEAFKEKNHKYISETLVPVAVTEFRVIIDEYLKKAWGVLAKNLQAKLDLWFAQKDNELKEERLRLAKREADLLDQYNKMLQLLKERAGERQETD